MVPRLIVIGASPGGLSALQALLAGLPRTFPVPLVVVARRGRHSDDGRLYLLSRSSRLAVREPEDKEEVRPGQAYLAPRDYHLLIEKGYFTLSVEGPVLGARPSIDVLFESAAVAYGERVAGLVLGDVGEDGAQGLIEIKERGGLAIVQELPVAKISPALDAVVAALGGDRVWPLRQIALWLEELCPSVVRS